jgi:uncharacterized protein
LSVCLLDVNVLIALFDRCHIFHARAQTWFARQREVGVATCAITENGFLRILCNPRYPNPTGDLPDLIDRLGDLRRSASHEFWRQSVSITDSEIFNHATLLAPAQITDTYLLGLAKAHGGKLASFDRRIVTSLVHDGAAHLEVI